MDSFTLVGDQSDMYSDTSSRSAKCFLPNTAVHGLDGHLLRVENLKIGDRVRLLDQTEASVVGMHLHRAKKKPYNLVELTTRQGLSTVSKSHRVAVPSLASEGGPHQGGGGCSTDVSIASMLTTWFSQYGLCFTFQVRKHPFKVALTSSALYSH